MEKDIDKIPKNPDTDIIIRIDDFGGKRGLTIREFVKGERYTGFTKAGTRIPVEHFKQFKDAINSIDEAELQTDLPVPAEQETLGQPEEKRGSSGQSENGDVASGQESDEAPNQVGLGEGVPSDTPGMTNEDVGPEGKDVM